MVCPGGAIFLLVDCCFSEHYKLLTQYALKGTGQTLSPAHQTSNLFSSVIIVRMMCPEWSDVSVGCCCN